MLQPSETTHSTVVQHRPPTIPRAVARTRLGHTDGPLAAGSDPGAGFGSGCLSSRIAGSFFLFFSVLSFMDKKCCELIVEIVRQLDARKQCPRKGANHRNPCRYARLVRVGQSPVQDGVSTKVR